MKNLEWSFEDEGKIPDEPGRLENISNIDSSECYFSIEDFNEAYWSVIGYDDDLLTGIIDIPNITLQAGDYHVSSTHNPAELTEEHYTHWDIRRLNEPGSVVTPPMTPILNIRHRSGNLAYECPYTFPNGYDHTTLTILMEEPSTTPLTDIMMEELEFEMEYNDTDTTVTFKGMIMSVVPNHNCSTPYACDIEIDTVRN